MNAVKGNALAAPLRPARLQRTWADLAWLLLLLVPLRMPVDRSWLVTGLALLMLPLLYVWSNRLSGPWLWFNRIVMFGMGVGLAPFNTFFHTLFIYAGMPAAGEIAEVAAVARKALTDVRQAITGVRSLALPDALGNAEAVLEAAGLSVTLSLKMPPALAAEQEMTLAQAVLEATTNVVRHAHGATQVTIEVAHGAGAIDLRVEDNGCGGKHTPGHGLRGMQARLNALGGSLAVHDLQPGTRVLASLPLIPPLQLT